MGKARKILKRAKAARSIRTVTKTMEMVASARFKQAHHLAAGARPYTSHLSDLVADLIARSGEGQLDHPLLRERLQVKRDVLLVLTSNRGLCGAFNAAVLRTASDRLEQLRSAGYQVAMRVVGKRGIQYCRFHKVPLDREYPVLEDLPDHAAVSQLAESLIREFLLGEIGGVEVAYMQFISLARQRPVISHILPLMNLQPPPSRLPTAGVPPSYEFLPSMGKILEQLLPAAVKLRLYQCFLDSAASEQVMRIVAMRAATDNADEMIHTLTIRYNRLRQAEITTELAEIMGGRAGLEE